jgi:hypothetical protein
MIPLVEPDGGRKGFAQVYRLRLIASPESARRKSTPPETLVRLLTTPLSYHTSALATRRPCSRGLLFQLDADARRRRGEGHVWGRGR